MNETLETLASFTPNYLATLGLGALCAYLGIFTVLRRIVFTGAALAQAAAAGVAASFWVLTLGLPGGVANFIARFGATAASLAGAVGSALALARTKQRGRVTADAKVGVVFAAASALAILFVWRSSNGLIELKNILAGDVLLSSSSDITSLWFGVVGVAVVHAFLRKRFLLVAYDPNFARAQGLDTGWHERAFLASLAVAVALALRAAGLLLVFGTLVLPPLAGLTAAKTLNRATTTAIAAAWTSALVGFWVATSQNLPVAPTIVAVELALFGLALLAGPLVEWLAYLGGAAALTLGCLLPGFATETRTPDFQPVVVGSPKPANAHGHQHSSPDARQRALDERIALVSDLSKPPHARVRAAEELERLGALAAIRPLVEAMGDPQPTLAQAARESVVALAKRGTKAGTTEVLALAQGFDPELAAHAARALVDLEHDQGYSLLIDALANEAVPLLLRDELATFLEVANGDADFGFDAFASAEDNADALAAMRAWATGEE